MINKYILENPYKILGIMSNSGLKEVQKSISKLKAFTKINKKYKSDFDIQELSFTKQVIDENNIEGIQRNLNIDLDRIKFAFFWMNNGNTFDKKGIDLIKEKKIDEAIKLWSKITEKSISKLNFSTYNNLSSLLLIKSIDKSGDKLFFSKNKESLEEINKSIELKYKLLNSEFVDQFFELITNSKKSFSLTEIKDFYNECLIETLNINFNQTEITKLLKGLGDESTKSLKSDFSNKLIKKIRYEIYLSIESRNKSFENSYEVVLVKKSNTKLLIDRELSEDVSIKTKDKINPNTGKITEGKPLVILKKGFILTEKKIEVLIEKKIKSVKLISINEDLKKDEICKIGIELMNNTKKEILQLKGMLGSSDVQYITYTNKVAMELNQIGVILFNETGEHEEYIKVYKYALLIAESAELKHKLKESIKHAKEIKKAEGSNEILKLLKNYKNKKNPNLNDAKKLLDNCEEKLKLLKVNLGETNEMYLMFSSLVANSIIGTIIEFSNKEQEELNNMIESYNNSSYQF